MKHVALLALVMLLAAQTFGQVTSDSSATEPVENTIAEPVASDTTTTPAVTEEPVAPDTASTPAVVAEPVPLDTTTTQAAVPEPVPLDTTTVPAVVAAPLAADTTVTQAVTADTLLTDTTALAPAVVADTMLTDTTAMPPHLVADTLKPEPKSIAPVVAAAAVVAAPVAVKQVAPVAPIPKELALYRAMYDTLKRKVFKYDFKPERISVLLDSLRMSKEKSLSGIDVAQATLMDTVALLKMEHLDLRTNADSLAAVIAGRPDRTVLMSRLRDLKDLLDQEILTQMEFNALKAKLLLKWE